MRVLLTGVTGFAGGHLAEALLRRGNVEVFGVSRRTEWPPEWLHLSDQVTLLSCDLCSRLGVEVLVREVHPDQVYHLAGYSNVGQSYREPDVAWALNVTATRNLYNAIIRWGGQPRILYVSSGLVYGEPEALDRPPSERSLLQPASPYASSKAAADLASYQHALSPGLDIVRVRPFNHIGPRQSPQFAVAHFAQQIAAIEQGEQSPSLEVGNLNSRRDLTDVRDMVRAYTLLMEHGRKGEVYNAGTGKAYSMRAVLDHLLSLAEVSIEVRQQSELLRAAETNVVRADISKIQDETGWQPSLTLEQTLADTLNYWRHARARV
jgi:GDP-4-dehydro-6-deoxy-D-mannose reductase